MVFNRLLIAVICLMLIRPMMAADANQTGLDSLQALQQLQRLAQSPPAAARPAQEQNDAPAARPAPAQTSTAPPATDLSTLLASSSDEEDALAEAAFRAALQEAFPMTPEQILRYRQLFDAMELAESTTPTTPPKPIASSQFVHLSPGSTPPVVRLAQGFVSSVVFLDSTGAPWPIVAYDIGNPEAFNIQWDRSGNTLMIQASQQYTYGNMAVRLKGLNTPVMLTLVPGQKVIDYRVDMRVQGVGPNANRMPAGVGLPPGADPLLLSILDGISPPNGQYHKVLGGPAQAWSLGNTLYLRTELTILSPGWLATMQSADGMRAYELHKTPVLLVSQNGEIIHLKIEGL